MSGYRKLATLMGAYPEIGIFRRFAALNNQNLLYLQAELVDLETRLRKYEDDDEQCEETVRSTYGRNWYDLSSSVNDFSRVDTSTYHQATGKLHCDQNTGPETRQWRTALLLRSKLKEYNDAVLQQAAFTELAYPSRRDMRFLQRWMKDIDMGHISLLGQDFHVYESPDHLDLFAMKSTPIESPFTSWLSNGFIEWFQHNIIGPLRFRDCTLPAYVSPTERFCLDNIAQQTGTVVHSQTMLIKVGRVIAISLSSVIPVLSIVLLHAIESSSTRLGLIAAFTTVFCLVLSVVTNGRPIEIFAASAAYAAILVVFVGTDMAASR